MVIHVKLFAVLRDAAGTAAVDVDMPAGARAGDVRAMLASRFPGIERYLPRTALAVNRDYASAETELREGDEVALIPPVSGG